MYRWCAYCQHYLGERAPLDDYSLTHGICEDCEARDVLSDDAMVRQIQPIAAFYREVVEVATRESTPRQVPSSSVAWRWGCAPTTC